MEGHHTIRKSCTNIVGKSRLKNFAHGQQTILSDPGHVFTTIDMTNLIIKFIYCFGDIVYYRARSLFNESILVKILLKVVTLWMNQFITGRFPSYSVKSNSICKFFGKMI